MKPTAAHLHRIGREGQRRSAEAWHGIVGAAVCEREPSETATTISALLDDVERHLERARKLLRDAECGVRQMRRGQR